MSKAPLDKPDGYNHVIEAAALLDTVVDDIFRLPEVAEERAKRVLDELGEDHGDDLLCGCWAAAALGAAQMQLLGRHIDAAIVLARQHAAFAAPVQTLARAVIEQALKITWLLSSNDPHTRERRFYEFERAEKRHAKNLGQISEEGRLLWDEGLIEFLMKMNGEHQEGIPSVETLANEYDDSQLLYQAYRMYSQPIHGTASGASTFHVETRQELERLGRGTQEWMDSEFVSFPLLAMWRSADIAMRTFRDLLVPDFDCSSLDREDDFIEALKQVPPNIGWLASQPGFKAPAESKKAARVAPKPNRAQRRRIAKLKRQEKR